MKVAVVLAGCGVYDGSEIYEATLTMLFLDRAGVPYQCLAPNIDQMHVINHLTGEVAAGETRNVLVEAARLARGEVMDLADGNAADYDALIVPGGFGVAKNLCNFAVKGADMTIREDVTAFVGAFRDAGKPVGLVCIAPVMAAQLFGEGTQCTIGKDQDVAAAITAMGGDHHECAVSNVVSDGDRKLVTTPAYMLAKSISEAASGIERLVDEVLKLV